jgi:hypothetical protein
MVDLLRWGKQGGGVQKHMSVQGAPGDDDGAQKSHTRAQEASRVLGVMEGATNAAVGSSQNDSHG